MDRLNNSDFDELAALCKGGVSRDVNLSSVSRWRIGGRADLLLRPTSTEEVASLRRWFSKRQMRPIVIGQMTNLLFDDAGLRVPCIQIGTNLADVTISGAVSHVQAGAWVPGFARKLMQAGLGGAEHICGIPGTLGGLICMNGGSQRKSIGTHICEVESVNETGQLVLRNAEQCKFEYRKSIFQANDEIITAARLQFEERTSAAIRSEMCSILADRNEKFPRREPNCGSVFKSNPAMYRDVGPPGSVIERLGFKGKLIGGAMVSPKHANFIVNTGSAKANDVLALIREIHDATKVATGYQMEAEVCFVSSDGDIMPADSVSRSF